MVDEQANEVIEGAAESESSEDAPENDSNAIDLTKLRDLVLAAHPDVVPEMVQGSTFDELIASVDPAREAYQRIAGQAAEKASEAPSAPRVAAQPGQRGTAMVDVESLSPLGKISQGLRRA